MLVIWTYLAPSPIHGIGLFAGEDIAAGAVVARYDPLLDVPIAIDRLDRLPPAARNFVDRYCYPSPHTPGGYLLETDNGRFMNHSASPNCTVSPDAITALRAIAKGEEITCDYGEFHHSYELMP